MMSKKDMLTLGVLAVGGVAVASSFAGGGDTGALEGKKGRAGGILGSQEGYGAAPTIYNLPAAAPVTFPEAPKFDISKFLTPLVEPTVSRGAAGVSSAGKKSSVRPYLYTGGEVKAGAVSVAPWAMGRTTPTEIGVTTALKYATTKKPPVPTKKREVTGRGATPGRMGYGKSYAKAHGGN
jgi:hypothetical protein